MKRGLFILMILFSCKIWSFEMSRGGFEYRDYNDRYYTLQEAYAIQDYDKIEVLFLRVDKTIIDFYFGRENLISVSDFKNLKSLIIIVDFVDIKGRSYETNEESAAIVNEWLSDISSLQHDIKLTIPSNIDITPISTLKSLEVYFYKSLNTAIYGLKNVESLNLVNHCYPEFDFSHFMNLKQLFVHIPGEEQIEFKNILNCQGLEILKLSIDSLTTIDLTIFPENVKQIDLDLNRINYFDFNVMARFIHLNKLELHADNLEFINLKSLRNNLELSELKISAEKMQSFNFNDLNTNQQLSRVLIEADSLTELVFPNTSFISIVEIEIESKMLLEIPKGFNNFPEILSLKLLTPKLRSMSDDFFKTNSLLDLRIMSSSLEGVPDKINFLNNLRFLTLSLQDISGDYKGFKDLSKLEQLIIRKSEDIDVDYYRNKQKPARLKKIRLKRMLPNTNIRISK